MKFSLKKLFLFILVAWFFSLLPFSSLAQTRNPDPVASVSASNEPLSQILDRLSRNTGITFSYNPDHIEASKLFSINMTDKKLSEILAFLLPPDKFDFRFSGNQMVIFRNATSSLNDNQQRGGVSETNANKPKTALPDTVIVTQTRTIRDTISRTDTIVKFDTVYIMRTVTRDNPITGKDIFSNLTNLSEEQTRELRFEAGLSVTWLVSEPLFDASSAYSGKLNEFRNSFSARLISATAGADLRMSYYRFSVNTGLSVTSFSSKLDYNFETSTGGYFRKDTLDAYYTLISEDTSWYYVLDSTYLPVDLKAYRYKTMVSQQYIEIPFTFQYSHPYGKNLIYANAGLIAGIPSGRNGLMIAPDQNDVVELAAVEVKPVVFSYVFGAGILIPVHGKITFDGSLMYRRHLGSVFSDFPVDFRSRAFGLKAGLIYKLY